MVTFVLVKGNLLDATRNMLRREGLNQCIGYVLNRGVSEFIKGAWRKKLLKKLMPDAEIPRRFISIMKQVHPCVPLHFFEISISKVLFS